MAATATTVARAVARAVGGCGAAACLGNELPLLRGLLHRGDVGVLVLGRDGRRLHVVARRARRLPTRLTGLVEPAKRPDVCVWAAWQGTRRGTRAGAAPASRARVDGLRTLATLVRVGRRVHEHAVLRMLAIRERRLSRRRSRLAAAAHAQHAQVRQEEAHAGSRCVCSPRSGVLVEHGGPCRHASPRSSAGELLRAKEGGTQRPDGINRHHR